jgi:hypothetical protein
MGSPPSGDYEICPVCYWEDDLEQFENTEKTGGANKVSLNQARLNFKKFGACTESMKIHVRPPRPEEIP